MWPMMFTHEHIIVWIAEFCLLELAGMFARLKDKFGPFRNDDDDIIIRIIRTRLKKNEDKVKKKVKEKRNKINNSNKNEKEKNQ